MIGNSQLTDSGKTTSTTFVSTKDNLWRHKMSSIGPRSMEICTVNLSLLLEVDSEVNDEWKFLKYVRIWSELILISIFLLLFTMFMIAK